MDDPHHSKEMDRLVWRCRRGTRELDLLLGEYLAQRYATAPAAHQAAFRRLLEMPEPRLMALLTGRAPPPDKDTAHVLHGLVRRPADTP